MPHDVILNVEDDDATFFVIAELFKEVCPDLRLERARNGIEALATLRHLLADDSVRVAFVIMDIFMPIMDGLEALEAIRSVRSLDRIPILIFTGVLTESSRARCVALNVECAEKPADLPALTKLVEEICHRVAAADAA
jgi:two-component system, chemotaxis family, sensor kinase CheA